MEAYTVNDLYYIINVIKYNPYTNYIKLLMLLSTINMYTSRNNPIIGAILLPTHNVITMHTFGIPWNKNDGNDPTQKYCMICTVSLFE